MPDVTPDEKSTDECPEEREVKWGGSDLDSDPTEKFVHLRKPAVFPELSCFRGHLPRFDKNVDQQVNHQHRSNEIEHDGGDYHMASAFCLEVSWNSTPDCTKQG